MLENITIVEYDETYAESVAKMWRMSTDGWNGEIVYDGVDAVIQVEKNYIYEKLWLAVHNNEVVGYCKLTKMDQENAMQIDYLNVRSDYRGKKIGKMLILKSIEETVNRGKTRLDLYTWTGNLFAVPLYKKCGFQWEKHNLRTHMMCFIPYILNSELLKPFFKEFDWYENSIKEIKIEPDDIEIEDRRYFQYKWEKNGSYLVLQFEKTGRGLRKIECEDYSIETVLPELEHVFNRDYNIKYKIINKRSEPLNIQISGRNDRNILFDINKSIEVDNEAEIEGLFHVKAIDKEYPEFKMYPSVCADIKINGNSVLFKTGIVTKYPANINLSTSEMFVPKNKGQRFYLNIENSFKEPISLTLEMPEQEGVSFSKRSFSLKLGPQAKAVKTADYKISKALVYDRKIKGKAVLESGEEVKFEQALGALFACRDDVAYGNTRNFYAAGMDRYFVLIFNQNSCNKAMFMDLLQPDKKIILEYPQIGEPFSDEFVKEFVENIEVTEAENSLNLIQQFESKKFPGISISRILQISNNGFLTVYHRIHDSKKSQRKTHLKFRSNVYFKNPSVFPHKKGIMFQEDATENLSRGLRKKHLKEPWLFSKYDNSTDAIIWDMNADFELDEWGIYFENEINSEIIETSKVEIVKNYFADWKDVHYYVTGEKIDHYQPANVIRCTVNNGNPFVDNDVNLLVEQQLNKEIAGFVEAKTAGKRFYQEIKKEDDIKKIQFNLENSNQGVSELIKVKFCNNDILQDFQRMIFRRGNNDILLTLEDDDGRKEYVVDNGLIKLKSSPDFAPVVHSLKYNGSEWLDSSYPEPCPRGWLNPWYGGIVVKSSSIRVNNLIEDNYQTRFIEINDNFGQCWKGLAIDIEIKENKDLKGWNWSQYYLMLPGVPVILISAEIRNRTDKFQDYFSMIVDIDLCPGKEISETEISYRNLKNKYREVLPGNCLNYPSIRGDLNFSARGINDVMTCFDTEFCPYSEIGAIPSLISLYWISTNRNFVHNESRMIKNKFLIFGDQKLKDEWLNDLSEIRLVKSTEKSFPK